MYRPHGVSSYSRRRDDGTTTPDGPDELRAKRQARRGRGGRGGFGALADRTAYLTEFGADGRTFDPELVDMEISEAEFETARLGARPAERPRDEGGTGGEGEGC
ncbi:MULTISPECIES: hypothetical protein [unclassified Streptomyces]|uniref:hypothetical protein n=1 Tax=unclassified Streptomyces TaxID=2593676 RepID=UPI002E2A313A|nr:hypothetical protein [Streptomyces sp. NBC_00273]